MLLLLKLTLVPALVLSVSLAARRWGPRFAGLLTGIPLVTAPALFFFAVEQSNAFAAEAARSVLLSLVGVSASTVTYAWVARRLSWWLGLPVSWVAFLTAVLAAQRLPWPATPALATACVAIGIGQALLPHAGAHAAPSGRAWDLPLRMLAAMTLILTVTTLAERLGPTLSGAFTPFPVAASIMLGFSHAQQGPTAAISFARGFMLGMWSFAAFCYVIAIGIVSLGTAMGFVVALACTFAIQGVVLWWVRGPL
jgi:hypothetical protein